MHGLRLQMFEISVDGQPRWQSLARIAWLVFACALLGACAAPTSRMLPQPAAVPALEWVATAPDGTRLAVRQLIVRNSAGSWVRDADWDEYVLEVENHAAEPLTIERLEIEGTLPAVGAAPACQPPARCTPAAAAPVSRDSTTSRLALERDSSEPVRFAKDAGLIIGSGLAPLGAAAAIVGTSGTVLAASSAALVAGAAAVIIVAPIAITVASMHVHKRHRIEREDRARIDQHLSDHGVAAPLELAADARLEKSAYFSITPAPARIGIHYRLGGDSRELWLPLPELAALHLRPAAAAPQASAKPGGANP